MTARFGREWLYSLDRRFIALLLYFAAVTAILIVFNNLEDWLGWVFVWTIYQGESSYLGWRYIYGFHPLRGYLAIVLTTATLQLTAMWFIFFKGEGPLLELPRVKRIFNPGRFPRLYAALKKKRSRLYLFRVGLIPTVWWLGFLSLREQPVKFGVATVLFGNAVKLTVFAFVVWFGVSTGWLFAAIGGTLIVSFVAPRLIERFLPPNNRLRRF